MRVNLHRKPIQPQKIEALENALDAQLAALKDDATPLTAEDRKAILKMGVKTRPFVEAALQIAKANPDLISKSVDVAEFEIDFKDATSFERVLFKMKELNLLVEDMVMVAGSEAMRHGLDVYEDIKDAEDRNVPNARASYETLFDLYPHHKQKPTNPTDPEPPEEIILV